MIVKCPDVGGGRVALKPRVVASASGQCLGDTVVGQHPG